MHRKKLLKRLIAGKLGNVAFTDMRNLAIGFGFQEARKSGSHHIYIHYDIPEL
jgi:predicted RNA binding protein YcfA (HicA-like mRNA interferase family)